MNRVDLTDARWITLITFILIAAENATYMNGFFGGYMCHIKQPELAYPFVKWKACVFDVTE